MNNPTSCPPSIDNPLLTEQDLDALFGSVQFVSVKELARFLRLSPKTLYEYIERGKMPVLRVGRNIRISRNTVRYLLQHYSLIQT